jgi:hypothetical protein
MKKKLIAYVVTVCLFPDSIAQKAHYQSQDPSRSNVFREIGIRWTGDRDELSARFQHPQRFFEHVLAQAIQDEVIIVQDFLEVVLLVIDDDICTKTLHQIDIRRARCRRHDRTNMLRQLNCKCSNTTGASVNEKFLPFL